MTKLRSAIFALFLLLSPVLAQASPMQAGAPPTRASFFPAAAEIGQQLQELVTGEANAEIEPQETFGTRALGLVFSTVKFLIASGEDFLNNFAALPQLSKWASDQAGHAATAERWREVAGLSLLALVCGFVAGWLFDLLLLPLRKRIYNAVFTGPVGKSLGGLGWLLLSLIPIVAFVAAAFAVIDAYDPTKLVRFIVLSFVYAAALMRLVRLGLRLLFAPKVPSLQVLPLEPSHAAYFRFWATAYAAVALFGYFLLDIAAVVKVPSEAILGFRSLLALVIVTMTSVVIVQKRSFVSMFLRGDLSAARANLSLFESLRLWLARSWHVLAIAYLVIGYFVTMTGPDGGFLLLQKGTLGTFFALLFVRLVFYMSARLGRKKNEATSGGLYKPVLKLVLKIGSIMAGLLLAGAAWELDVAALVSGAWGQRILGSAVSIAATMLVLTLVYEFVHASVERKLNRRDGEGNLVESSARAKTLLPLVRYIALVVLSLIGGFVVLSELGINTGPLLAGAGVLGVALGFGSQTLVKDFLTGLFIILEDNFSVGDVVRIGDNAGLVESMTIRTVRLRDAQGNLHILPFSEINRIVNSSKGFAFALVDIGVSYSADLNKVMDVMREVGDEMSKDPAYRSMILEPLEVLGVESFSDSSVTVRCRMKTLGGKQHDVRRAYQLRLKLRFDQEKIEIPFPQRVVYLKKDET